MIGQTSRRPPVLNLAATALAQSSDLVQAELRLARAELSEKLSAMRNGLVIMALGAILLIVALGMLLQAVVGGLIAAGVSPPIAVLLVAGVTGAVGVVLFVMGQQRLDPATLEPDRTIRSLSADTRMVKETLS